MMMLILSHDEPEAGKLHLKYVDIKKRETFLVLGKLVCRTFLS